MSASPGCEVACCLPICPLLLSKQGLWPSLWPVWHLSFSSIQKKEGWDRRGEIQKKKKPFWKLPACPKVLHCADAICFQLMSSKQSLVLSPRVLVELWLSCSAARHCLAVRVVVVGELLVWNSNSVEIMPQMLLCLKCYACCLVPLKC